MSHLLLFLLNYNTPNLFTKRIDNSVKPQKYELINLGFPSYNEGILSMMLFRNIFRNKKDRLKQLSDFLEKK